LGLTKREVLCDVYWIIIYKIVVEMLLQAISCILQEAFKGFRIEYAPLSVPLAGLASLLHGSPSASR
jgi:hypothetical protein